MASSRTTIVYVPVSDENKIDTKIIKHTDVSEMTGKDIKVIRYSDETTLDDSEGKKTMKKTREKKSQRSTSAKRAVKK
jgi:hypothetical protein